MKDILQKFSSDSLFDASAAMLDHLKIKFTVQTKKPVSLEDLYYQTTSSSIPKSLKEVLSKIANTYIIGSIDEASLQGRQSVFEFGAPIEGKYDTMLVFAVDVKPGEKMTRTEIAILTRGFNRMADSRPVIIFVRSGNYLSLATCERSQYTQQWREGEKLGKVSILRDINCVNPHRGHIDILESIGDKEYPIFDELYKHWLEVFSSELLTKKFYTELSEWYAWVIGSGEVKFPNDISTTDDDMKYNHEAVIRLITRIIFVWFLRQKKLVPAGLFDEEFVGENFIENFNPHSRNTLFYNPKESKYYRLILQNLFFAMLNRPIIDEESGAEENRRFVSDKRYKGINPDYNINNLLRYRAEFRPEGADKLLEIANSTIPFLNGGLFECLDDKDSGKYYDGFSERKASLEQLSFPDYFFFGEKGDFVADLSEWYDDKKKKDVEVTGLINILKHYNFTVEENTPLDQEVSLDPELLGKVFENLLASYNPETNTSARKQTGSFYTPREIVKYMVDESLIAHLCRKCPDLDEPIFRNLFDYSVDNFDLSEADRKRIMQALYECKVLDPACGSGAFPMGMLQQMVHALRKLDPSNEMWRDFILELALAQDKAVYKNVEDEEERSRLRKDIEQSFNRNVNDPDYARKLYLIENCIYGVDIQPIAVQISKLRFFISLVAEQKPTSDPITNFGIRPLPNLEAKFVAANSLIPLEKEQNLFGTSNKLTALKEKLTRLNHKLFLARRNAQKKKFRQDISEIRKNYSDELISMGSIGPSSAALIASWDMFEQNTSAPFFDPEWMFGVSMGFDIVIGNPPYVDYRKIDSITKSILPKYKSYQLVKTGSLYVYFIECGLSLLKKGCTLAYINPYQYLSADSGSGIREVIFKNYKILKLVDVSHIKVFDNVSAYTAINFLSNDKDFTSFMLFKPFTLDNLEVNSELVPIENINKDPKHRMLLSGNKLIFKIEGNCNRLDEFCKIFCGLSAAGFRNNVINSENQPSNKYIPFYEAKNIKQFQLCSDKWIIKSIFSSKSLTAFKKQCIFWARMTVSIRAAISNPGDSAGKVNVLHSFKRDIYALCAIINSKLLNYYYVIKNESKHMNGGAFNFDTPSIKELPICKSEIYDSHLKELVLKIMEMKYECDNVDVSDLKNEIDLYVYRLYNLTYDEILIIDPETIITREEYENE